MITTRRRNTGSILICVLACLAIVTALAGSMLKTALQARKAMRQELQLRQAEFLLEAGVQRAVKQLNDDSTYTGESWKLPRDILPSQTPAVVEIKVIPPTDDAATRVAVVAQLATDNHRAVRRSYTFSLSHEE